MNSDTIVRAWEDDEYRSKLSPEEQAQLPSNPAGLTELNDDELRQIQGGFNPSDGGGLTTITGIGGGGIITTITNTGAAPLFPTKND
jgi:mersacidin/lichenicidin family type 2 lantibiotic